ncbi:uncharacterized protein PODANS_5_10920, partial [Podospora anserina S mat+]
LIFVAGLGGHYLETWKHKDEYGKVTIWPRDLLGLKHCGVENVRVWSFHYNTTLRGASDATKVTDHAHELLDLLMMKLTGDLFPVPGPDGRWEFQLNPIIFVGHSLGGMLIKRAMLLANTRPNYHMFFAVPHHGLDRQDWKKYLKLVLNINSPLRGLTPSSRMEAQAIQNSGVLADITDEFRRLQEYLFFVNYVEGKVMPDLDAPLVDEGRGWMDAPRKLQIKLEGHHLDLCRFAEPNPNVQKKGGFQLVVSHLKHLMGVTKALEHIGDDARRALESLCPTGFHGYFMAKQATTGTCGWISERKEFQDWVEDDKESRMLWIQGPPASGKSFLARHIITDLIPSSTTQKVAHCFLDESVAGRRTLVDLLRATLHHALRIEPELIQHYLVPPYLEAQRHSKTSNNPLSDDSIWTLEVLVPLWPEVVSKVTARDILTVVVDGFDEMSRDCQDGFFSCIDDFTAKAESQEQRERLKVLLISREDGKLKERKDFQHYFITTEDIREDVQKTVMAALTNIDNWDGPEMDMVQRRLNSLDTAQVKKICDIVVESSNGDHHLANLKAQELFGSLVIEPISTTAALAKELPNDTASMYDRVLRRAQRNTTYQPFLKHILRWAAFQIEPLKEAEVNTAVALSMAQDQVSQRRVTTLELESLRNLVGSTRAMVQQHGRRLVEVKEGVLQPVNQTLKSCLTKPRNDQSLHLEEMSSHAALAKICIEYLTMPYFADSRQPTASSLEDKVKKRIEEHPFSCYAAPHWDDHVAAAGSVWGEADSHIVQVQQLLRDETTHYGISCAEVRWYLKRRTMDEFPLSYRGALDEAPTAASTPLSVVDSPPLTESPDTVFESSGDVAATGITIRSLNREHEVKQDDPTPAGRINHAGPAVRDQDAVSGVGHPRGPLDVDTNFQNLVALSHGPIQSLNQLERKGAGEAAKSPIAVQRHPERTAALERHDQPPERSALSGTTLPLRYVERRKTRSLRDVDPLELLQPKEATGIVDSLRKADKDPVSVGEQSMLNASVNPPVPQPTTAAQFSNHRPSQNAPTRPTDRGVSNIAGQSQTRRDREHRSFYDRLQQDPNLMDVVPPPPDLDLERRTMNAMLNTNTPSQQPAPPTVSLLPNIVPVSPQQSPKRQSVDPAPLEPRSNASRRSEETTSNPAHASTKKPTEARKSEEPVSHRAAAVRPPSTNRLPPAAVPTYPNLSPTTYTADNRDTRFRNEPQPQPGLDSAQFPYLHDDDQSQDGSERSESVAGGDTPAQKAKRGLLRRALHKTAKRVDEASKRIGMTSAFVFMAGGCDADILEGL